MTTELFSSCPVCRSETALAVSGKTYRCEHCGFTIKEKHKLFGKQHLQYVVQALGEGYDIARAGLVGNTFSPAEVALFREQVYPDAVLAEFAAGNFDRLNLPGSVLAKILLEQLRETVYLHVDHLRRAHGPALETGGNRFPQGKIPRNEMDWQDDGNLFLTNVRIVFPSNTFTFIRMGRKMVGLKTFEDGIAVQLKGENHATYFVGCKSHQAALVGAYIQGRVPGLRAEPAV